MNICLARIHAMLLDKGEKAAQMCDALKIAKSTWYTWVKTDKIPDSKHLPAIASHFGTTIDYLLGADDDIGDKYYVDEETKAIASQLKNNPGQKVLFNATKDCTPEDILKVVEFIQERIQIGDND